MIACACLGICEVGVIIAVGVSAWAAWSDSKKGKSMDLRNPIFFTSDVRWGHTTDAPESPETDANESEGSEVQDGDK